MALLIVGHAASHIPALLKEVGKVRCWLTGFEAGRGRANMIPGEDSLRQLQVILGAARTVPEPETAEEPDLPPDQEGA